MFWSFRFSHDLSRSGSDHCNPSLAFSSLPKKRGKLLFLYVFRVWHFYIPTCSLKVIRIIYSTDNEPAGPIKNDIVQTSKEFNFNYFTVNPLSIFFKFQIELTHPHKRVYVFWSVYRSSPLRLLTRIRTANVVGIIKHYCNFHYPFYESAFSFFSSRSINIVIVYSILHSSRHLAIIFIIYRNVPI